MAAIRTILSVVASASLLAALSGCGSDGATEATEATDETAPTASVTATPSTDDSGTPTCESVWTEGADLPKAYDGCIADGTLVAAKTVECSSGQRIVLYDDQYWAVRGHVIGYAPAGLDDDKHYARVLYSCRA